MSIFSESYLKDDETLLTEKANGLDMSSFFSDIKAKFKKEDNKAEKEKLATKASRFIFAKRRDEIMLGFPSIMTFTRGMVCLGLTAVNPFIGVPLFLVDKLISEHVTEKDIDKYIEKVDREIAELKKEIESASDADIKDDLELLLAKYEEGKEKLEKHKDKITRYHTRHDIKDIFKTDDDKNGKDDDFDDFDFNFDETMAYIYESAVRNPDEDIPMELIEFYFIVEGCETLLSEKATNKVARTIQQTDKKVSGAVDRNVEQTIGTLKKAISSQDREDLIKGALPKASRIIKTALLTGAVWMVNPVIAVIGALTSLALSSKIKDSEKTKILGELKQELEICEEKIKDADSRGDNKKKYQLMRIRNKLNTDIERIRGRKPPDSKN